MGRTWARSETEHYNGDEQHKITESKDSHEATQLEGLVIVNALEVAAKQKTCKQPSISDAVVEYQRGAPECIIDIGMTRAKETMQTDDEREPHDHATHENEEKNWRNHLEGVGGLIH